MRGKDVKSCVLVVRCALMWTTRPSTRAAWPLLHVTTALVTEEGQSAPTVCVDGVLLSKTAVPAALVDATVASSSTKLSRCHATCDFPNVNPINVNPHRFHRHPFNSRGVWVCVYKHGVRFSIADHGWLSARSSSASYCPPMLPGAGRVVQIQQHSNIGNLDLIN